jgi:hypothetical protein
MTNAIIAQAINLVASLLLGSEVFTRLLATVERWAEKEISGAEKRHGVLDELQVIGLKLTESAARFGIELAVQYLKKAAK